MPVLLDSLPVIWVAGDLHLNAESSCFMPGASKSALGNMQVELDDMQHEVTGDGSSAFSYPCRCGEAFICREDDLSEADDSLLVQCQGCSLIIKVLYTVESST